MLQTRDSLPELKNSADAMLGAEPGEFQFLDIYLSHGENSRVPFPVRLGEKLIVMLDSRRTQGLHDICTGGELRVPLDVCTGGEFRFPFISAEEESSESPLCLHRRRAQGSLDICTEGELRVPSKFVQEENSGSPRYLHRRRVQGPPRCLYRRRAQDPPRCLHRRAQVSP